MHWKWGWISVTSKDSAFSPEEAVRLASSPICLGMLPRSLRPEASVVGFAAASLSAASEACPEASAELSPSAAGESSAASGDASAEGRSSAGAVCVTVTVSGVGSGSSEGCAVQPDSASVSPRRLAANRV